MPTAEPDPDPPVSGPTDAGADEPDAVEMPESDELARPRREASLVVQAATPERDALMQDPSTLCLNCGNALPGAYCPSCGQKAQRLRQPVHLFLRDSFVEFFGLDGRIWKTLGVLLFKPGRLTSTYIAGRRMAYLRPLRIYLSSTLLFFVLLATLDPVRQLETQVEATFDSDTVRVAEQLIVNDSLLRLLPVRLEALQRARDSIQTRRDSLEQVREARVDAPEAQDSLAAEVRSLGGLARDIDELEGEVEEVDEDTEGVTERMAELRLESALLSALPPDTLIVPDEIQEVTRRLLSDGPQISLGGPDWLTRSRAAQALRDARTNSERGRAAVDLLRGAIGHIPTVMFIVLPVFAFILKVLYVRRDWYYSEHLVFGLHTHAFAFVIFSLIGLASLVGSGSDWSAPVITVLALSIPLYFLLAQKHVYRQGWIRTVVKAWVLGWVYLSVIGFGLVAAFLLAATVG
ncbi:MAG: DUF3667 domain-containing protein [Bacteroidota bacterium]